MRVACFCGVTFDAAPPLTTCPLCGEPVYIPRVTDAEWRQMKDELATLIEDHNG